MPSHVLTHSSTAGLHSSDWIKLPEIQHFSIMSGLDGVTGAGVQAWSHHGPVFFFFFLLVEANICSLVGLCGKQNLSGLYLRYLDHGSFQLQLPSAGSASSLLRDICRLKGAKRLFKSRAAPVFCSSVHTEQKLDPQKTPEKFPSQPFFFLSNLSVRPVSFRG